MLLTILLHEEHDMRFCYAGSLVRKGVGSEVFPWAGGGNKGI